MSILRKIKFKITPWLIRLSLVLSWPWLTALILALSSRIINFQGKYTVLVLRRSIFIKDVEAMARFSGKIKYIVIDREYLKIILRHFLGKKIWQQITEANYHKDQRFNKGKRKYYLYLKKIYPILQNFVKFEAIITANIGYIEQQELAKLSEENQTPFVILHKEGMVFGDYVDVDRYKELKFVGDKILFYNSLIKRAMLDIGILGLTKNKAHVVGIPRFDFYLNKNNSGSYLKNNTLSLSKHIKQIVFFSFYPSDMLFFLIDKIFEKDRSRLEEAKRKTNYYHKLIMTFAEKYPDLKVIIKTKNAEYYLKYVENILKDNFSKKIDNLIITNKGGSYSLIQKSDVVIGFNSTTLIESIAANKITLSFDFRKLISEDRSLGFFKNYPQLANYVETEEDLKRFIIHQQENIKHYPDLKVEFLKEVIFTPDGKAGQRAEQTIIESIKKFERK